jgi:acetyltransferase
VVVHDKAAKNIPRPAIRPYPSQYISHWTAKDGSSITFRPVRPEDEPKIVEFHKTLSDRSVYLRFFTPMLQRAAQRRRICHGTRPHMTLVAERDRQWGR